MLKLYFENKITLAYLLIGSLWILFSDRILHFFVDDANLLTQLQTFKGWFYILITALLLHSFLKNHLEKLRAAQQRALESDKLKTAFIQNISHEVRTPMNGILGFTNLLVKEDITPQERKRFTEYVSVSTLQLLTIVEEIIELSLIQVGNVKVKESNINLDNLMEDILTSNQPQIKPEVNLSYKKSSIEEVPTNVLLDSDKVKEIFRSLINNANKFSEEGQILFGYSIKNHAIEFFVKDSGIGISPELQQTIFESFRKSGKSNKLYDGVGLGLSICKGYLQLLNGSIRVESEPNKGSCFYFTLPLKHPH